MSAAIVRRSSDQGESTIASELSPQDLSWYRRNSAWKMLRAVRHLGVPAERFRIVFESISVAIRVPEPTRIRVVLHKGAKCFSTGEYQVLTPDKPKVTFAKKSLVVPCSLFPKKQQAKAYTMKEARLSVTDAKEQLLGELKMDLGALVASASGNTLQEAKPLSRCLDPQGNVRMSLTISSISPVDDDDISTVSEMQFASDCSPSFSPVDQYSTASFGVDDVKRRGGSNDLDIPKRDVLTRRKTSQFAEMSSPRSPSPSPRSPTDSREAPNLGSRIEQLEGELRTRAAQHSAHNEEFLEALQQVNGQLEKERNENSTLRAKHAVALKEKDEQIADLMKQLADLHDALERAQSYKALDSGAAGTLASGAVAALEREISGMCDRLTVSEKLTGIAEERLATEKRARETQTERFLRAKRDFERQSAAAHSALERKLLAVCDELSCRTAQFHAEQRRRKQIEALLSDPQSVSYPKELQTATQQQAKLLQRLADQAKSHRAELTTMENLAQQQVKEFEAERKRLHQRLKQLEQKSGPTSDELNEVIAERDQLMKRARKRYEDLKTLKVEQEAELVALQATLIEPEHRKHNKAAALKRALSFKHKQRA